MGMFKKVGSKLVDVRVDKWMSLEYIKETSERFKILMVDIVVPKKATTIETFEEAMQRLELTEADLIERKKEFTRLFYFFTFLALAIIGYALYLAFMGQLISALISFCLSVYAITQAFRFHFWLFQLKHRKLGCTIKEWMNSKISDTPLQSELAVKAPNQNVKSSRSQSKAK